MGRCGKGSKGAQVPARCGEQRAFRKLGGGGGGGHAGRQVRGVVVWGGGMGVCKGGVVWGVGEVLCGRQR